MTKVLIVDDIHDILIQKLRNAGIACDYRPAITRGEAERLIPDCTGLVVRSKFQVDRAFIDRAPGLRFIARSGAGMDNIDEDYALSRRIAMLAANEGNCDAMAEHMIGMLLSLMNNLNRADREIRTGKWRREENRGYELKGRTVAIIGYGHNGRAMARKLSGFGVDAIAYDKYKTGFSDPYAREATMEEIVRRADVLSFHIPLTRETKGLVGEEYLSRFEKPIFLLMGARGGMVDIPAVLRLLDRGRLLGSAFDVLPVERFPSLSEQPWYPDLTARDNVLLSPHVAGWTTESYFKLADVLADKICETLKSRSLLFGI